MIDQISGFWGLQCRLSGLLLSLLLLDWSGQAWASPPVGQCPSAAQGPCSRICVKEGAVSVSLTGAALDEVLTALQAQSRIRVVFHGARPAKVTAAFHAVPVEEAFRRLLHTNFLLLYAPDGQLVEVQVLSLQAPFPSLSSTPGPGPPARFALAALLDKLHSADEEQRRRAVLTLSTVEDERALEAVLGTLEEDADPAVRQGAIWALESLGGSRAIAALEAAVASDRDDGVRHRAVGALATLSSHAAVAPLRQALHTDPEPFVRYEALVHLAAIGGDRARGSLRQALADPDELVWAKAAELLADAGELP